MKDILRFLGMFKTPTEFGASATPLSQWTYRQIANDVKMKMKNYKKLDFTDKLTSKELYRCVLEYFGLQGFKDDPAYRAFDVIPVIATVTSNQAAGASYNATGRILTIPASGSGITWTGATAFASSFVGAQVKLEIIQEFPSDIDAVGPAPTNIYNTVIESVTNGTTVVLALKNPAIPSIAGSILKVTVTATSEQDEVDLTSLAYYKIIDTIVQISSTLSDGTVLLHIPKESAEFMGIKSTPTLADNYSDDVIFFRSGSVVRFRKGGNLTSYGVREMEYTRFPVPPTSLDSYVDIPDTAMKLMIDMICLEILETENKGVPARMQNSADIIMNMRKANAEKRAKLNTNN